jgi:putative ABC transport system permease protein
MKLEKSFELALNILIHSKLRSWLTILGIVIGVAAIVAIVSIGEGAQASVNSRLSGLGADIATVTLGHSRAGTVEFGRGREEGSSVTTSKSLNLTEKDVQAIKSVIGVLYVNPILSGRAQLTYLAQTASISVNGVDPFAWSNIDTNDLAQGRKLNPGDSGVIVISDQIATRMFKTQIGVNQMVSIEGHLFKVVGVLASTSSGFGGGGGTVYMSIDDAKTVLSISEGTSIDTDNLNSIQFKVDNADNIEAIVNATQEKLMNTRHLLGKSPDFTITDSKQLQTSIASVTQTFTLFLAAIAAVSLIVGAVGIANTMFTAVLEKTKEIGIMKAIGARNFDIMTIFLLNSALVGFVGGLIGAIIGSGISAALPNLLGRGLIPGMGGVTGVKTVIPVWLLVSSLLVAVAIGMIAGAIPAYRASKLKPVDALRYE